MRDLLCFSWRRVLAAVPLAVLAAAVAPLPAAAEPDTAQGDFVSCKTSALGKDALAPGTDSTCTFNSGVSKGRFYIIHVPTSFTSPSPALIIDLHGFGLDAQFQEQYSGQEDESEALGFIAIWPQGTAFEEGGGILAGNNNGRSWNAGTWIYKNAKGVITHNMCCGAAAGYDEAGNYNPKAAVDDVAFLTSVIRNAEAKIAVVYPKISVDPKKVYVTGLSNGGAMTHRMACQASDVVNAAAAISFPLSLSPESCSIPAKQALSVFTIQGNMDHIIPYNGGEISDVKNLQPTFVFPASDVSATAAAAGGLQKWGAALNCAGAPGSAPTSEQSITAPNGSGTVTVQSYDGCNSGKKVKLITLPTKKHITYNDYPTPLQGDYLTVRDDVPATIAEYLWSELFIK